jgi:hypothetical protein
MIRLYPISIESPPNAPACQDRAEECRSAVPKRPDLASVIDIGVGSEDFHPVGKIMDRKKATGTPFSERPERKSCLVFARMPDPGDRRQASVNE